MVPTFHCLNKFAQFNQIWNINNVIVLWFVLLLSPWTLITTLIMQSYIVFDMQWFLGGLAMEAILSLIRKPFWLQSLNKFSTVMTSLGPVFQECTGSCHDNVAALKAVLSDMQSKNGLTILARTINTITQWNPVMTLCAAECILQAKLTSLNT